PCYIRARVSGASRGSRPSVPSPPWDRRLFFCPLGARIARMASLELAQQLIRDIPDFPQPGILFKDITPILGEPRAFQAVLDALEERLRGRGFDRIVAIESRGFVFGAALADRLEIGFSPVRKLGKLPYKTHRIEYAL